MLRFEAPVALSGAADLLIAPDDYMLVAPPEVPIALMFPVAMASISWRLVWAPCLPLFRVSLTMGTLL